MFTGGRLPSSRSGSLAKLTGTSSGCGCGHGPHLFKYEPDAALLPPRETISEAEADPRVDWRCTASGDVPDHDLGSRVRAMLTGGRAERASPRADRRRRPLGFLRVLAISGLTCIFASAGILSVVQAVVR